MLIFSKRLFFLLICVVAFISQPCLAEKTLAPISLAGAEWIPFISQDVEGIPCGLYADIFNELFVERLGVPFAYKERPWSRAQLEVKTGASDFVIALPTEERLDFAVASKEPFLLLYLSVYTYKDHEKLHEIEKVKFLEDIKRLGLTCVSNIGNGWHQANVESAGIKTHYVLTEENAIQFLANKRADIMIDMVITTNSIVEKLNLTSVVLATPARFGPIPLYFLMSKKSPYLSRMGEIEETFIKMQREGVLDQILIRYTEENFLLK